MSRGDRRLSALIEQAWRQGARLDGWSDHFNLAIWQQAAADCGVDLAQYLRQRESHEKLPWQHLDVGVDQSFLATELDNALKEVYTQDCRIHGCSKCGLCDFKTIQPKTYGSKTKENSDNTLKVPVHAVENHRQAGEGEPTSQRSDSKNDKKFVYRFWYEKTGKSRFLSHLELIQVLFRAFRRAGLPVCFSQGFNPSPKVSFGPALPLGTESMAEYFYVDLYESLPDPVAMAASMNSQLPDDLMINRIDLDAKRQNGKIISCYQVSLDRPLAAGDFAKFFQEEQFDIELTRKGKKRNIDAKPLVKELAVTNEGKIHLILESEPGKAGVKPMEFLTTLLRLPEHEMLSARVVKQWIKEPD